ncbi:uncharacterized protein G2W53_033733 [Senna tora]|uniref:Uncharacterized protein n=1 Tax=Senna tora TaxID=362788 RepID=A0A834T0M7_9FABA|nr:uncharacterized protein G2W53_033733 [Senna tora]
MAKISLAIILRYCFGSSDGGNSYLYFRQGWSSISERTSHSVIPLSRTLVFGHENDENLCPAICS